MACSQGCSPQFPGWRTPACADGPLPTLLQQIIMVFLPLSLVIILCSWILCLFSSLSQNITLLVLTGCYFLLGGEFSGMQLKSPGLGTGPYSLTCLTSLLNWSLAFQEH